MPGRQHWKRDRVSPERHCNAHAGCFTSPEPEPIMSRTRTLILHKRLQARRPRLGLVRAPRPPASPGAGPNAA
jgi:hypothetical protein